LASIKEIAADHPFKGQKFHKFSDLGVNSKYSIDHSGGKKNSIYTSIDCYVSGSYISNTGQSLEIKQRYTVYVAYNRETQKVAMNEVRQKIIDDFSMNFPQFRVSDVFIPETKFITPLGDDGVVENAEFYHGSNLYKAMSRIDVAQYKVEMEKNIYKSNVKSIKKRYGL
jgi:hypothetical protein